MYSERLDRFRNVGQSVTFAAMVVIGFGVILLPLLLIIWLSFFQNAVLALPPSAYTLSWYAQLADQSVFVNGFVNSFVVALLATAIGLAVSIPASFGIVRGNFLGRELMMHFLTAPLTVPAIVIGAGGLVANSSG